MYIFTRRKRAKVKTEPKRNNQDKLVIMYGTKL